MLNKLLQDHAMLREKGEALIALLDLPSMPDRQILAQMRWEVSSLMMQHLALEDRYLYAKLISDPRPHVRSIGERFQQELLDLYAHYSEQGKYWTQDRIAADWDGYRHAAKRRTHVMFERIEREESELYPLIAGAAIDINSHAPHTTNWAREAFAIKDAMTTPGYQPAR